MMSVVTLVTFLARVRQWDPFASSDDQFTTTVTFVGLVTMS